MPIAGVLLRASAVLALAMAGQARAITFVLNDTGGAAVGTQARMGFDVAAGYWSRVLTNNVTVNLNIGFQSLGAGILGSTGSRNSGVSNIAVYSALASHVTDSLDALAVANLQPLTTTTNYGVSGLVATTNSLNAARNGYLDTSTRVDNDGSANNSFVGVNTSVAKALGLTTDYAGNTIPTAGADGSITFSSNFSFDFDPTDGVSSSSYDFVGVAIHEIGHALGFVSGVDSYDSITSPGSANTRPNAYENTVNATKELDYFRYSSAGNLDWSTQNTPYFSVDGGATQLFGDSLFSTGVSNGDGRQASHWKDSPAGAPQLGVMDPTSGLGQMQEITALDIAAFDAIGWSTSFDPLLNASYRFSTADAYRAYVAGVPEPATWSMMILGFGAVGGAIRLRSRRATVRLTA